MSRRRAAAVAGGVVAVLVVALLAWWLGRDEEPPAAAPEPVPTLTPTPSPTPTEEPGPCEGQARVGFVPTRLTVPGVVRKAAVIGVPRDAQGVVGVLPHADNQNFAWDLGGVEPGSPEGHVLLNTHTWPDGSAMGNRLLDGLQVGDALRLEGDDGAFACYRVGERVEVPVEEGYPGWAAKDGPPQVVIVVCSGKRLGPGDWTHRTLWFAEPVDPLEPVGSAAEEPNPTPTS
ncbi:class F sortase [Nocardioides aromaticivorans]|uniref:class F sortase n=1 Tax=Nocardioides aromaticivorans TaxID=200618 RepID=UPI001A8C5DA3|nr:class F sortase [Nocardioides aromaticivorans]